MIDDLFPELPYDTEPGMKPCTEKAAKAAGWLKQNALPLLSIAIGMMI